MRESSEVLARKYRPINFDELIGQESISQTLSLALDANRLSHAYLFSGLRGSGKTSTARIFSKALICEKGISHKPCGVCQNCILALENRHIDIVEMDGASSRKIDDIRDLIEQTKYKPATARFKIFIIDEVHMLTKEAFNALLKTLEEPPSYVKFILATTDPLKLPATILSRTQHFRFKSIATNKIADHLSHILNLEGIKYESEALDIIARSGSGSLRDTLTLLDQAIIYSKNYVDVRTVTDMLGLVDPKFLQELFNAVFAKDYAKLIQHVKSLEDYEAQMVLDELIAFLKERMYASDALYSTLVLDRFFRILSDAKYLFSINADGSFVLSLIFFKMVEALRIKEVDQMIESLQKEIYRPAISCSPTENLPLNTTVQNIVKSVPNLSQSVEFDELLLKIKDRNFELGECFAKSISFISYDGITLTWESCADEECKKVLTHGYGVIKQLVREIFGFETKIRHEACTKEESTLHVEPETPLTEAKIDEPSSMIEEAEFGGSASCVTNCQSSDSSREINGADIKDEPMVQKAIELFEAKKITIQSKV
ncbi:DNA polymerase III, tau subunit [Sulfurimonas denitrificans DSM 1251]|uniref:DNA polymerase III subunit gamma/tau n=1 Tax=Sulfurimonas denitrificans (strain ATCC 33889 / DSM 1251) TaxID=326298 RepID=Q30Q97_SULDN|nr:DNA polymerase III subunit gamma/tau [Sulfurimonas denitrificans]ABB44834.1 DNA polymerase III, tau subunit [Sulfurimonas denitrificans DSM 1251]MDD3443264.1 DNA polymerase III subunit gamma/tau [Sulfurimonas denitrificans]